MDPLVFFQTYFTPALEFVIEIVVITVLLFHRFARKKHFVWRSILAFVILLALSYGAAWLLYLIGHLAIGKALVFLLLFIGLTLVTVIPFNESYPMMLFSCGIAYAVQNLIYKTFLLFWTGAEAFNWFAAIDDNT